HRQAGRRGLRQAGAHAPRAGARDHRACAPQRGRQPGDRLHGGAPGSQGRRHRRGGRPVSARRFALAAVLGLAPALAAATAVTSGTEVGFNLPGISLAPELFIDVPEGAAALRVEIESVTPGRDLDLVVRSATPFQVGQQPDPVALFDQAQYRSTSPGADEYVTIAGVGRHPLVPGRWYI